MPVSLDIVRTLVESRPPMRAASQAMPTAEMGPDQLPPEWRCEWLERTAILQFDGGLTRETADKQALQEILARLAYLNGETFRRAEPAPDEGHNAGE
jgi:hypothetical protein